MVISQCCVLFACVLSFATMSQVTQNVFKQLKNTVMATSLRTMQEISEKLQSENSYKSLPSFSKGFNLGYKVKKQAHPLFNCTKLSHTLHILTASYKKVTHIIYLIISFSYLSCLCRLGQTKDFKSLPCKIIISYPCDLTIEKNATCFYLHTLSK